MVRACKIASDLEFVQKMVIGSNGEKIGQGFENAKIFQDIHILKKLTTKYVYTMVWLNQMKRIVLKQLQVEEHLMNLFLDLIQPLKLKNKCKRALFFDLIPSKKIYDNLKALKAHENETKTCLVVTVDIS